MMLEAVKQPGEEYQKRANGVSKGIVGFGVYKFHESPSPLGIGQSITFGRPGSKGSGKQYTCYNKFVESKGRYNCIRHELKLFDDKACEFFEKLCDAGKDEETLIAIMLDQIFSEIDFKDVSDYDPELNKIDDCPRFDWWQRFIGDVSHVRLAAKQKNNPTLETALTWVRKQVSPTLAAIFNCYYQRAENVNNIDIFWQFFYSLWSDGDEKMSLKHHLMIAQDKVVFRRLSSA